jgi:hypothetical protein
MSTRRRQALADMAKMGCLLVFMLVAIVGIVFTLMVTGK